MCPQDKYIFVRRGFALVATMLLWTTSTMAADQDSMYMKVFGAPVLGVMISQHFSTMEQLKKFNREQTRKQTLSYWLGGGKPFGPSGSDVFKDGAVSFKITFADHSDFGTAKMVQRSSNAANKEALRRLRRMLPLSTPPSNLPYQRGLIIRFSRIGCTIHLASKPLS
jgi:hypothetical protein